jgi:hypothetical protein
MYLTPMNEECIYSPQCWVKTIDEGHQWMPKNGWRAMMSSKCSSFRLSSVTILKGFGLLTMSVRNWALLGEGEMNFPSVGILCPVQNRSPPSRYARA